MKITTPSFLTFFFLILFALTTTPAAAKSEPILDATGKTIISGSYYLFSPAESIGGRVIIPTPTIKEQEGFKSSLAIVSALYVRGWPVRIASDEKSKKPIRISTSTSLSLSFEHLPLEQQWSVVNSTSIGLTVLLGKRADFGSSYVDGFFYIKPSDSSKFEYYLRFCRYSKSTGEYTLCGKVGIEEEKDNNGNSTGFKHLVVKADDPLVFKFVKDLEETSGISMVV